MSDPSATAAKGGAMPWVFGHKLEWSAPSGMWLADIGTLRVGIEKRARSYAWFAGHVAHGETNGRLDAVEAIKGEIRKLATELQEAIK